MYLPALYKAIPYAAINVVALFGNTLVCLSVYRNPRLRSKIGTVILALAVTDLISSLTVIPLSCVSLALGNSKILSNWITGNRRGPLCYLQGILFYALTALSTSLMALAAFIRYLCVVKNDYYRRYVSTKSILFFIGVMAAVIVTIQSSVLLPKYAEVKFARSRALCFISFLKKYKRVQMIMFWLVCAIWVGIPLVVSFVCYTMIFCNVQKHNQRIHEAESNSQQCCTAKDQIDCSQISCHGTENQFNSVKNSRDILKDKRAKERKTSRGKKASSVNDLHSKRESQVQSVSIARKRASDAKVTKTILAVLIGFVCCWSITFITMLNGVVYSTALSSAVNPFIYGAADRRFRQTYRKVLTRKRI